jgi:hypothetical protein
MAILYVILTAEHPRVLLIDEPHSFLHPAAIRKLLEILKSHWKHQYIITTHSPVALAASNPSTLVLLRMEGPKTVLSLIDPQAATELRLVLAEVGARLSDVYGADNILWVEGRTEELCFPLIREKARDETDPVTAAVILGVRNTGEFEKRHARATIEIYRRLTSGVALLPPAVGFIFDAEGRTPAQQADLTRQSNGLIRFLPRRTFENYLLVPEALAALMNSVAGFRDTAVLADEITDWLTQHRWDKKYFHVPITTDSKTAAYWLRAVDGASLLSDIFGELSERRVTYNKVEHGLQLTRWLCDHNFDHLAEIANLIRQVIALGQPRLQ